jgi:hypothetical protein
VHVERVDAATLNNGELLLLGVRCQLLKFDASASQLPIVASFSFVVFTRYQSGKRLIGLSVGSAESLQARLLRF